MAPRECYHCKQLIDEDEPHDCWTTTEAALTADLSEDLRDAWERLRETAVDFGEQRIYASHNSIMFSRKTCYFFVRPKKSFLEVCVFLGRAVRSPRVRRVKPSSSGGSQRHHDTTNSTLNCESVESSSRCLVVFCQRHARGVLTSGRSGHLPQPDRRALV